MFENFLIFNYPNFEDELITQQKKLTKCKFKIGLSNKKLVFNLLKYNGLEETFLDDFNIFWGSSIECDLIKSLIKSQKLNHFFQSKQLIGDKSEFAKIIQNHPLYFNIPIFFPRSYILPQDYNLLYQKMKTHSNSQFISKPPKGSCGIGIKIITFKDFYSIPNGSVVSDYISRPLLIDGFKFDLRIYVLVTSFYPLRAFIYKEGLARFATEWYSRSSLSLFSSLTNATLNKKNKNWCKEFKWKLSELLLEIEKRWNKSKELIFNNIIDLVQKSLILIQPSMSNEFNIYDNCFELFGYDILIDQDFKLWLLEINTLPSLNTDEDIDYQIKAPLISQTLTIIGINNFNFNEIRNFEIFLNNLIINENYFEEKIIKEDQRNKLSGEGFIRIFPSNNIDQNLNKFLLKPNKILNNINESSNLNLTNSQGLILLIHLLTKFDENLKKSNDLRLISRLKCFLIAQGYNFNQNNNNIRLILKHFIIKLNKLVVISKEKYFLSIDQRKNILKSKDFKNILEKSIKDKISNIELLFP